MLAARRCGGRPSGRALERHEVQTEHLHPAADVAAGLADVKAYSVGEEGSARASMPARSEALPCRVHSAHVARLDVPSCETIASLAHTQGPRRSTMSRPRASVALNVAPRPSNGTSRLPAAGGREGAEAAPGGGKGTLGAAPRERDFLLRGPVLLQPRGLSRRGGASQTQRPPPLLAAEEVDHVDHQRPRRRPTRMSLITSPTNGGHEFSTQSRVHH